MYCDCILGSAGWQSGYIPVFVISGVFVVAALMVLVGGWRTKDFARYEAVKEQVLDAED